MRRLAHAPHAVLWSANGRALTVTAKAWCYQGITILPWSLAARPYNISVGLS